MLTANLLKDSCRVHVYRAQAAYKGKDYSRHIRGAVFLETAAQCARRRAGLMKRTALIFVLRLLSAWTKMSTNMDWKRLINENKNVFYKW